MAPADHPEMIDQAFFGFDGRAGMSLLASSIEDEGIELRVARRLTRHSGLRATGDIRPPDTSLSYLRFADGSAAVLRRVNRGDTPGRTNAHALVGPPDVLTPQLAIGLRDWPDWCEERPVGRRLLRLDPGLLRGAGSDCADLRRTATAQGDRLVRVLAEMLDRPDLPVSIFGCAPDDSLSLLTGLIDVGRTVLGAKTWTFSTYETEHADAIDDLPEIVFLPMRPLSMQVAHRVLVGLEQQEPAGDKRSEARARELVRRYRRTVTEPTGSRAEETSHTDESNRIEELNRIDETSRAETAAAEAPDEDMSAPAVRRRGVRVDPAPVHAPPSVPQPVAPVREAVVSAASQTGRTGQSPPPKAPSEPREAETGEPGGRPPWSSVQTKRSLRSLLGSPPALLVVGAVLLLLVGAVGYLLGRYGTATSPAGPAVVDQPAVVDRPVYVDRPVIVDQPIVGDRPIGPENGAVNATVQLWLAIRQTGAAQYLPLPGPCQVDAARKWMCYPGPDAPQPAAGDVYVLLTADTPEARGALAGDPSRPPGAPADPIPTTKAGVRELAEVDAGTR